MCIILLGSDKFYLNYSIYMLNFMLNSLLQKYRYSQSQYKKTWDSKCQQALKALHESKRWGFKAPPSGQDFLSQNISNVNCTSKNFYTARSSIQKNWLALIAEMVRALGMNLKVGGSSPPQVKTFSVSTTLTLLQEHHELKMNAFACAQFQMFTLLQKYQFRLGPQVGFVF